MQRVTCERQGIVYMTNNNMYRDCKMVICCVGFDEEYEVYNVTSNVYQVE